MTTARTNGYSNSRGSVSRLPQAVLRVPLTAKLAGANLVVVVLLLGDVYVTGGVLSRALLAAAVAVVVLHLALIYLALRPIRDLELVAARVWEGDFGVRVERSKLADHSVSQVVSAFNGLLDGLAADHARVRALATDVIAVGDRERAALARELHDSTAQQVAALLMQLSAAARDAHDPGLSDRLRQARDAAESILEEVRLLAHTVHPAVLDDLGLEAALRKLARDLSHGNGIDFDVNVDRLPDRLPVNVEAVLYRVAEEAVRNATHHASPNRVRISLAVQPTIAVLEVHDDGRGFDLTEAERRRPGTGLASMKQRVALIDGALEIRTAAGSGTTVLATVPLDIRTHALH